MTGPAENLPRLNSEKARWAAKLPDRPGEKCGAEAGAYRPVVDRNACEGKRDCVEVCPYDVFEVRRIDDEDFSRLTFLGKH
jgi:4Fe-4S ferredoxin